MDTQRRSSVATFANRDPTSPNYSRKPGVAGSIYRYWMEMAHIAGVGQLVAFELAGVPAATEPVGGFSAV